MHVGKKVFSMILVFEIMFRNISDSTLMAASNLIKLLVDKAEKLTETVQFIKRKLLSNPVSALALKLVYKLFRSKHV